MANCHEMKQDSVYVCRTCGLELRVVAECRDAGTPAEDCGCHDGRPECRFMCCGAELVKK